MDTRPSQQLCWHRRVLVAKGARSASASGPLEHAPGLAGLPRVPTRVPSAPRGWSHVGGSRPGPEWGSAALSRARRAGTRPGRAAPQTDSVGTTEPPWAMAWTVEAAGPSQSREVRWGPRGLRPLLRAVTGVGTCPSPGRPAGAVWTFTWRLGLLDAEGQREAWLTLRAGDPTTREAPGQEECLRQKQPRGRGVRGQFVAVDPGVPARGDRGCRQSRGGPRASLPSHGGGDGGHAGCAVGMGPAGPAARCWPDTAGPGARTPPLATAGRRMAVHAARRALLGGRSLGSHVHGRNGLSLDGPSGMARGAPRSPHRGREMWPPFGEG